MFWPRWVSGHSWGAMYSTTFACRAELADKVKGVVLESGSGMNPACAGKISVISSVAENDIGPVINQGAVPSTVHGVWQAHAALAAQGSTHSCSAGFGLTRRWLRERC